MSNPNEEAFDGIAILPGRPNPLGAHRIEEGVNFALCSAHATRVWLALFDSPEAKTPAHEIELDARAHRLGDIWCVLLGGLPADTFYAYRVDGPQGPDRGHAFDTSRYLIDPYARAIVGNLSGGVPKCAMLPRHFPHFRHPRPSVPLADTILYETHLRGMTQHPSSGARVPGTYRALIEKIPYLIELGVTAIEFLPLQECGELDLQRAHPETGEPLTNYWGYNTLNFFSPAGRYATSCNRGEQVAEFREMVEAMHAAGLELIIDIVLNHTSEGTIHKPAQSFRGIDNAVYYLFDHTGGYLDLTGCGNTLHCNHPVTSDLILDCLRYWVAEMGADGFRIDLATVLNRDRKGFLLQEAPIIERIASDPILKGVKLIAEAWDAGGGYQVGSFGSPVWSDWNDQYRNDVRAYWRGDADTRSRFALRLTGSPDIYQNNGRGPLNSLNFITAHDGFTLRDLVSYNEKHNDANGEANHDGANHSFSCNWGAEGDTRLEEVLELRLRIQKSCMATLFLSLGLPMLLGGDEFGRTQRGNNNAYCHDNELSWYNWTLLEPYAELHRFCRETIRFRKANPVFRRAAFFDGKPRDDKGRPDIAWFGAQGLPLDWHDGGAILGCVIHGSQNAGTPLALLFNPTLDAVEFIVPEGAWRVRMDTAQPGGKDIVEASDAHTLNGGAHFLLGRKSLVVLEGAG